MSAHSDRTAIEKPRVADMTGMDVDFKYFPPTTETPQKSPVSVIVAAYSLVALVFVMDWITPALVAVGLAYQAPVVLAGLKGTRNLTQQMIALGVIGLIIGWSMDFAADSFHFSADRIENRLLSVLSLLVVGCLTTMIQRSRSAPPTP